MWLLYARVRSTYASHFCQSVELDAVFLTIFIIVTRYVTLLVPHHHNNNDNNKYTVFQKRAWFNLLYVNKNVTNLRNFFDYWNE